MHVLESRLRDKSIELVLLLSVTFASRRCDLCAWIIFWNSESLSHIFFSAPNIQHFTDKAGNKHQLALSFVEMSHAFLEGICGVN